MVVSLSSTHWSWEAGPGGTLLLLLSWWGLCTGSPSQKMGDHGVRAPTGHPVGLSRNLCRFSEVFSSSKV